MQKFSWNVDLFGLERHEWLLVLNRPYGNFFLNLSGNFGQVTTLILVGRAGDAERRVACNKRTSQTKTRTSMADIFYFYLSRWYL